MKKVAIAAASVFGMAGAAQAGVVLEIADLDPITLATQSIKKCDTRAAQGALAGENCAFVDGWRDYSLNGIDIAFRGTVGGFSISTTSGLSNIPGTPDFAFLDTSSTSVKNLSANGTGNDLLYINFIGFNFLFPAGGQKTMFGSASYSGTVAGSSPDAQTIDTFFFADPSNFGTSPSAVQDNCLMNVSTNGSCNTGAAKVWNDIPGTSFSLSSQQFFRLNGQTQTNATTSLIVRPAPEPMTLGLVSVALLGAGLASRRRSKRA
jgi:hypothetical protein